MDDHGAEAVLWLRGGARTAILTVHVQPGARKTEIIGPHGDALKIRLAAPPVDGKANTALIEFIAKRLDVPKSSICLIGGQTSRRKLLEIASPPANTRQQLLPSGANILDRPRKSIA